MSGWYSLAPTDGVSVSFPGSPRPVRAEAREGQQGDHRLQHHVHRGAVPALPASALEVPEDGRQQAV